MNSGKVVEALLYRFNAPKIFAFVDNVMQLSDFGQNQHSLHVEAVSGSSSCTGRLLYYYAALSFQNANRDTEYKGGVRGYLEVQDTSFGALTARRGE